MADQYCIKWDGFNCHLGEVFRNLWSSGQHVDVTLNAQGLSFKCHKIILCAASPYFEELLGSFLSDHPIIILADVEAEDLRIILDFMYQGEIKNINYERFISVLKTADMLKINGLTELSVFQTSSQCDEHSLPENVVLTNNSSIYSTSKEETGDPKHSTPPSVREESHLLDNQCEKDSKKYGNGDVVRALKDLEWGMPLIEATKLHKIPRSTLYSKAKHHSNVHIVSRKEYSNQDCHSALQAIADGMSFKRAAEEYNIPKTVLWRRVQKRLDILSKVKCRKKGGSRHLGNPKAPEGSQMGERHSEKEVYLQDLRDNEPILEDERKKKMRLAQAVAACKMGTMSQAVASTTFQVPKTAIWRCLQKCSSQEDAVPQSVMEEPHQYFVSGDHAFTDVTIEESKRINSRIEIYTKEYR